MRVPVPKTKLVAFTLVAALLTTVAAGALAVPGAFGADGEPAAPDGTPQVGADAPTPNPNFTPAVQQSGSAAGSAGEHEDDDREAGEGEDDDHEAGEEGEHEDEEYEEEYESRTREGDVSARLDRGVA
ncbi:MAG: hypothetical protein ABEJ74_03995 [Haloferacaceae archaeon]